VQQKYRAGKSYHDVLTILILSKWKFFFLLFYCFAWPAVGDNSLFISFEEKYKNWEDYISTPEISCSSSIAKVYENKYFREIASMGLSAIPLIVEKTKSNYLIGSAITIIAKVQFRTKFDKKNDSISFVDFPELNSSGRKVYLNWWRDIHPNTKRYFDSFYADWHLAMLTKSPEAREKSLRLMSLGVDALPFLIQKIESGEIDSVPFVSALTNGEIKLSTSGIDCVSWWAKNNAHWAIPNGR